MSDAARAGTQSAGQVGAPTSVGIDVAETRKGLDLVALDSRRLIVASYGRLSVDDVVQAVLALRPTVVCIDSPSGWSRSGRSRLAERQLAQLGIQSYRTGPDPGDHPFYGWIRVGLQISIASARRIRFTEGMSWLAMRRRSSPTRRPPSSPVTCRLLAEKRSSAVAH
jgi:hypothetical protein